MNTANKGSLVLSTFGCLGKTTFARSYPELAVDIEAIPYKYSYPGYTFEELQSADHETLKGVTDRTDNPAFPCNYVEEVERQLGNKAIILIVLSPEILTSLEQREISYSIVYPDRLAKQTILKRSRERGNNQQFVQKLNMLLSNNKEETRLRTTLHPERFYTIEANDYLEDFIRSEFNPIFALYE